tara:strand:+ start:39 stop:572 length:534 start_codon:yes stop_codon:yes gene_type:complete
MGKQSKNLAKVQDMLDGNYKSKIQSGYIADNIHEGRKVGDKWTDSDGVEWEQKDGYRSKITKLASVGMFNHQCKDCGTNCSPKMSKPWDRDCFKADGRCYYCQMDYELDLKTKPIRWFAYRRLKDLKNMVAIEKDMIQWIDEMERMREKNPFDERVANALANGEVEFTINKNKTMTN